MYSVPVKQEKDISKRGLVDEDCYGTNCEWATDYEDHLEMKFPENLTKTFMSVLPAINSSQRKMVTMLNQTLMSSEQQLERLTAAVSTVADHLGNIAELLENRWNEPQRNCKDILQSAEIRPSGQYTINPMDGLGSLQVYCDMETDGGGWTVLQKRFDGSMNFYRSWQNYETGFGSADGEHWLGLQNIFRLTRNQRMILRIDMESFDGDTAYAVYDSFAVGNADTNYQLTIGSYTGTAGDSLAWHNGMEFSTRDRDNDQSSSRHCAERYKGAWWYNDCYNSNLNGLYVNAPGNSRDRRGLIWYHWKRYYKSVKSTEMKIRSA